jgi:hypothetical protein
MANYSINITDNGATPSVFTATVFRNPTTAASGGTAITGSAGSALNAAAGITDIGALVAGSCLGLIRNDRSTNG